jgi:MFS family permease
MMRQPKPWHFFFLILPWGASSGCITVALGYLLKEHGVSVEAVGGVIAASLVPHVWKITWAPVVDAVLPRKLWYVVSLALVSSLTFVAMTMPLGPATLSALTTVLVASQVALTLMGMACEALIGHGIAPDRKGVTSSYYQAGNIFGAGVGGGAALWLVEHLGQRQGAAIISLVMAACAIPLLAFDEPVTERPALRDAPRRLVTDAASLVRSRAGLAAIAICLSPLGAGAASGLFPAIADEWHATAGVVELATGTLAGVVGAVGAAAGAWIIARTGGLRGYAIGGGLTAAAAVAMAIGPRTPWAYVTFSLAYQAVNGLSFAAFSALVFETIGLGAVVTKYNMLAVLANEAIWYMTKIDSGAHARGQGAGVLLADAAVSAAALVMLGVAALWMKKTGRKGGEQI